MDKGLVWLLLLYNRCNYYLQLKLVRRLQACLLLYLLFFFIRSLFTFRAGTRLVNQIAKNTCIEFPPNKLHRLLVTSCRVNDEITFPSAYFDSNLENISNRDVCGFRARISWCLRFKSSTSPPDVSQVTIFLKLRASEPTFSRKKYCPRQPNTQHEVHLTSAKTNNILFLHFSCPAWPNQSPSK